MWSGTHLWPKRSPWCWTTGRCISIPTCLSELEKHHSRIQLLREPPYAPWTNPTEKVWRKLMQEVIGLHPFSNDWEGLKQAITDWFEPLHAGSEALLHYVGLRPQPKPPRKRCPD